MLRRILVIILLIAALGGGIWWYLNRQPASDELVLYGNVELRQVTLAFNGSQRIAEVLVEEGAQVRKDQVLARLETGRLAPQVAQAEAQVASQQAVVDRLRNGSRPEEIAQARANLEAARAEALNARRQYERQSALATRAVASEQAVDQAKAATDIADAKVDVALKALDLLVAGSRVEEIAQAEAQLRMSESQLELLRQELRDAELRAPTDAIVRSRLMEPGEMASPTRPVFSLATTDPKWVRAYVSETQLGRVRPGMKASVTTDSFPGRALEGWIGFISPVAEFTPKTVQTEELRTNLVYEVRAFVADPDNLLRLGMPATVRLIEDAAAPGAQPEARQAGQTP
ncbi:efflux RND transporter periplasmic adaptor subunit [Microvirga mediterraneensis]|uniref:Efflux RND transporter periplasmic adaptor subunit n=1 Tax=Microvirga mediterraneensis TaxID=2754695 RepID=A0A838BL03_9HYPH|nr:efflux RND transporter periplasmic adaptor subunit [Microvirga mediterraneensis]MBA1155805.1 efflux RND transporter periplasmic adaptor subunit [Microvirga mediterraneensis]